MKTYNIEFKKDDLVYAVKFISESELIIGTGTVTKIEIEEYIVYHVEVGIDKSSILKVYEEDIFDTLEKAIARIKELIN